MVNSFHGILIVPPHQNLATPISFHGIFRLFGLPNYGF